MSNKQKIASVVDPIETIKLMIEIISANSLKNLEFLNGDAIVSIQSGQIQRDENGKVFHNAKEWMNKYLEKNRPSGVFNHPEVGEIQLTNKGIKDSLSHYSSDIHVNAIPTLPFVLENSALIETSLDNEGKTIQNYTLAAPVLIDGKKFFSVVRLKRDYSDRSAKPRFYILSAEIETDAQKNAILTNDTHSPNKELLSSKNRLLKILHRALSVNTTIFKGRKNSVKTAKGTKIDTVLALVEADKLIVSHSAGGQENPNYPQELQPRDRSRDTSQAQIQRIANNLNPEDLGRNGRADSGAPIVGDDLVVESGNGRTIAIKLAYELGKADEYKEFLRNEADYFGFSAEQVDKFKEPVLVRIRLSEVDRAQFAIEANQDDKLSQTATERAKQDSKRIDNNLIMLFTPSEDGDFLAASNNKFVQGFLSKLGADESAQYVDSQGKPTQALVTRMKAAIFAKAYNDDRLLEMMADQSKPELQNMLNALSIAAPKFVEAQSVSRGDTQDLSENLVTSIEQSLDQKVMNAIIDATNALITAKRNNQDITEFVKQQGLFGDLPEGVAELAIFISQNNRSAKKMSIFFKALAEFIEKQGIDNQNFGLFGEPEPVRIKDAFNYAVEVFEQSYKENVNLNIFDSIEDYEDRIKRMEQRKQGSIDELANEAATSPENDLPEPTEQQKIDGNYQKGIVNYCGLSIAIENPAGSIRSGVDASGSKWESKMTAHYGYIQDTKGFDGDELDVFIKKGVKGDDKRVFIIKQIDPKTKEFDEHKLILGASNIEDAQEIYLSNYEENWQGLGSIYEIPFDELLSKLNRTWNEFDSIENAFDDVSLSQGLDGAFIGLKINQRNANNILRSMMYSLEDNERWQKSDTKHESYLVSSEKLAIPDAKNSLAPEFMSLKHGSSNHSKIDISYDYKEGKKLLTKALKKAFPNVRFSIKSVYGGYRVSWLDGASEKLVSQITNHFESRGRGSLDPTGDYWESGSSLSAINAEGQVVSYGLGEIELHRTYSKDFIISVLAKIKAKRMKLDGEDSYKHHPEGDFYSIEYANGDYGNFERNIVKIATDYNGSSYLAHADARRWGSIDLLSGFSESIYSIPEIISTKINPSTQVIDQDEDSAIKVTIEYENDRTFIDKVLAGEIEVNVDTVKRALSMLSEQKIDELAEYAINQIISKLTYSQSKQYLDNATRTPEQKLNSTLSALAFEDNFIEHVTAKGKSIFGFVLAAKGIKKEVIKEYDKYTFFKGGWFIRESGIKQLPVELLSEQQILAKEVLNNASVSDSNVESISELHSRADRSGDSSARWTKLEQLAGISSTEPKSTGIHGNNDLGISERDDASVQTKRNSRNELSPEPSSASDSTNDSSRSSTGSSKRSSTKSKRDRSIVQSAKSVRAELDAKAQLQLEADNVETEWADKHSIDEALPYLMPVQRDDVQKAEKRLIIENENGVLFTNGTGTGKTFTGLGSVKRFVNAGYKNILIVTYNDKVAKDFIKSGSPLNLKIHQLTGIKDNGADESNIVVTSFENFGQNDSLGQKDWDLIVIDEAHKLMQSADGKDTKALDKLHALSGHHKGFRLWAKMRHIDKYPAKDDQGHFIDEDEVKEWNKFIEPLKTEWESNWRNQGNGRAKVIFLSATPFSYVKTIEWAEGYLFNFTQPSRMFTPENDAQGSGYNQGDDRESFYMSNFGYRMRYNKLTRPEGAVNSTILERQFAENLKKSGAMSGRELVINFDYDRKFVLLESKVGELIEEGLNYLSDTKKGDDERAYGNLSYYVHKRFDYLTRRKLLESIKAQEGIPYFKKHLALNRKLVIFFDYNKGGGLIPFKFSEHHFQHNDGSSDDVAYQEYLDFAKARPDLVNLNLNYGAPLGILKRAFPNALIFNGKVSKVQREKDVDLFNTDDSGYDVYLIQSDAGSTGISLHDTTGTHQRVMVNIGQPTKPAKLRQIEGRILRVGQSSNAIQRYLSTGTSWERAAFADTIAGRAETVDNLAKGIDAAASIKTAIIEAYEMAEFDEPSLTDGTGGKAYEAEAARVSQLTPFDQALTYYYMKGKNTQNRKNREGKEWYATPEPLGLKMIEWAGVHTGDKVLEPSAGDGAIGRFAPEDVSLTMIEPTESLASRARMANTNADIIQSNFESHDEVNKYHSIVMNPPFGNAGSTAIKHIIKAFDHLYEGGRICALIPLGAMDEKLSKWLAEEKTAYLVGEITLPSSTFKNAGTAVNTRIVLIDKHQKAEDAANFKSLNYSSVDSPEELFERIRHAEMRPRKPRLDEQLKQYGLDLIIERKKYILVGEGLKNPTLTRLLSQYWWAELVNDEIVMNGNKTSFIIKEIKQYEKDNNVSLAIGT